MDKMKRHISQQFNNELEDIKNQVMVMGGIVEQQLNDALIALLENDIDSGNLVITRDFKVNALEVSIDEECSQIIARRQPAASDLRLIMAVIKTIADLERIGDEAERIGRMAVRFIEAEGVKKQFGGIASMGEMVKQTLHGALDAFARTDAESAVKVWGEDR